MELTLPFKGSSIDTSELTASTNNVRVGKVFIGADGTEQIGTNPEITAQTVNLAANGRFDIPAGIHGGESRVNQSIPTFGEQTIIPGAASTTVPTAGKLGTGDIIVLAVENLIPEYIKKGAVVGGVTGTFSAYIPM